MRPDVKINDISLFTLGWLRESVDFPTPQSQTNTIVVPGRNAPIRYTEALGSISYQPREFTILLSMLGNRTQFDLKVAEVVNRFAGRLCKVICSDTPQVYAIGTIEAEPAYDPLTGKGQLTLSCEDGDSCLYHVKETVVTKSGSGTVTLFNDYMPVVPVVETTGETALAWRVGEEEFRKSVSAGTWEFPEMELQAGENQLTVTAEGMTTFRYREGRL